MKPDELKKKYKVTIDELDGHKYYGSAITINDGKFDHHFELWCNADFVPSKRQLAQCKMTLKEWKDDDMSCDGHFESQATYDLMVAIKKVLEAL